MRTLINDALAHARYEKSLKEPVAPGRVRIVVVGAGGGGSNTVRRLMTLGINGAECIAVNTDRQHLEWVEAHRKILIGEMTTRGLGAGGFPELGEAAADESRDVLRSALQDADLVFITAGLGGGTGTGSAPVIAEIAKECGAIVVGVVTMPFKVERVRINRAREGLKKLQKHANTVVVLDNNRLLDLVPNLPLDKAFFVIDEVLANMVKGITETITLPSLVNLDFADVKAVMGNGGVALVGLGEAGEPTKINSTKINVRDAINKFNPTNDFEYSGNKFGTYSDRVEAAVKNALECPLLDVEYDEAENALVHVSGGEDLTLKEVNKAVELVTSHMSPDSNVIWGARVNPELTGMIRIMLILTGVKSPQLLGRGADKSPFKDLGSDIIPIGFSPQLTSNESIDLDDLGLDRID
ncbi:MAG: cell division protein FtsZ [Candidatus Odinarchaeia archaeon]